MGQFGSEQARRVVQGSGMSGAPCMGGIEQLAETVATDMEQRLPGQRKTQRGKLALLVATMLQVRSANLMDVAACLPRPAERLDSRYQWIKRFLANARVVSDAVMAPSGAHQRRHGARGRPSRTLDHRPVAGAVRPHGLRLWPALGHRGPVLGLQEPRLRA